VVWIDVGNNNIRWPINSIPIHSRNL